MKTLTFKKGKQFQRARRPKELVFNPDNLRYMFSHRSPEDRFLIQNGLQLLVIYNQPNNKYRVVHFDYNLKEYNMLVNTKDPDFYLVDYNYMLEEVIYLLEKNVYNEGEWLTWDEAPKNDETVEIEEIRKYYEKNIHPEEYEL